MCRSMHKPRSLIIRHFELHQDELNKYLGHFPGSNDPKKMGEVEMNEILLYRIPNGCSKQAYLQEFYFEVPFKKKMNRFERMDTME